MLAEVGRLGQLGCFGTGGIAETAGTNCVVAGSSNPIASSGDISLRRLSLLKH